MVDLNSRSPLGGCMPINAKESASVVGSWAALVLFVLTAGRLAQIVYGVIRWIAINVINLVRWPFAVNVQPSKAMCRVFFAVDANGNIPTLRDLPNATNNGVIAGFDETAKCSCRWVITQKFAQTLRGKIAASHEALQLLIGQRPAHVDGIVRASLF